MASHGHAQCTHDELGSQVTCSSDDEGESIMSHISNGCMKNY